MCHPERSEGPQQSSNLQRRPRGTSAREPHADQITTTARSWRLWERRTRPKSPHPRRNFSCGFSHSDPPQPSPAPTITSLDTPPSPPCTNSPILCNPAVPFATQLLQPFQRLTTFPMFNHFLNHFWCNFSLFAYPRNTVITIPPSTTKPPPIITARSMLSRNASTATACATRKKITM